MKKQMELRDFFEEKLRAIPCRDISLSRKEFFDFIDAAEYAINFVSPEGVITYANRYARATGIIPGEYVGRSLYDLKKQQLILNPAGIKVIETGKRNLGEVTAYGGRTYMSITVPARDGKGAFLGVLALTCDIGEVFNFILATSSRVSALRQPATARMELADTSGVMVAESPQMRSLLELAEKIAPTRAPVLIMGESGTGKEVLANLIHGKSGNAHKKMVAVNCGAIPANLMESELFGHERGAFTGVVRARAGLFEEANGGDLFLDEIGDLDLTLQVKLLRVLQEGRYRRVGGQADIRANVRIIAATNKNLPEMVARGQFRADLYYRLEVFCLHIPPLRQRPEDTARLISHFLDKYNRDYGFSRFLTRDAWIRLLSHDWPGNVRELSNALERLVVLSGNDAITPQDLEQHFNLALQRDAMLEPPAADQTLPEAVENLEKRMLAKARVKYGTCREMARHLGLDYSTVARKMRKYALK